MSNLGQMRMLDVLIGTSFCPGKPPDTLGAIIITGSQDTKTNNLSTATFTSIVAHIGGIPCTHTGIAVTGSSYKFVNNKPAYRDLDVTTNIFGISYAMIGSSTSRSG